MSGALSVAAAYKDTQRTGHSCGFGTMKSLGHCRLMGKVIISDTTVSKFPSQNTCPPEWECTWITVQVLSFCSISKTMTLLHTVQTTFTQSLYAVLAVCGLNTTVQLWFTKFTPKFLHWIKCLEFGQLSLPHPVAQCCLKYSPHSRTL